VKFPGTVLVIGQSAIAGADNQASRCERIAIRITRLTKEVSLSDQPDTAVFSDVYEYHRGSSRCIINTRYQQ
jgi:hypothetical protein